MLERIVPPTDAVTYVRGHEQLVTVAGRLLGDALVRAGQGRLLSDPFSYAASNAVLDCRVTGPAEAAYRSQFFWPIKEALESDLRKITTTKLGGTNGRIA